MDLWEASNNNSPAMPSFLPSAFFSLLEHGCSPSAAAETLCWSAGGQTLHQHFSYLLSMIQCFPGLMVDISFFAL